MMGVQIREIYNLSGLLSLPAYFILSIITHFFSTV